MLCLSQILSHDPIAMLSSAGYDEVLSPECMDMLRILLDKDPIARATWCVDMPVSALRTLIDAALLFS